MSDFPIMACRESEFLPTAGSISESRFFCYYVSPIEKGTLSGLAITVIIHSYNICMDKVERNGSHLW